MERLNFRLLFITILFVSILVPFNNCSNEFAVLSDSQDISSLSADESLVLGRKLYVQHCANCHGALQVSSKKDKSYQEILNAFSTVRSMAGLSSKLDDKQVAAIALALRSPKSSDGRLQYACNAETIPNNSIHRLSNREIKNTISSLLRSIDSSLTVDATLTQLLNGLPADDRSKKENTLLVTPELVGGQFEIAYYLGNYIAKSSAAIRNFPGTSGCLAVSPITDSCMNSFIKEFVGLAFRRPVTSTEQDSFKSVFRDSGLGSDSERMAQVISVALMSPDFLYLIFDQGKSNADGTVKLTAFEFASKLSYLITGAPPDATLRGLASADTVMNADVVSSQVSRLLKTDLGKISLLRFFKEWTHYDQFEIFNYSAEVLNGQSLDNLRVAMEKEVDDFLIDTVVNSEGTYRDILTSTNSFIYDNSLAQVYGIANPSGRVSLSGQHRSGILTRAAFLAKRSGPLTSPVKRGLLIKEAFLCEGVGSPPPDAPAMLDPLPGGTYMTTRDRLEHLTMKTGTSCINCHSVMNNLGFPFEMYDTLGRVRERERIFKSDGGYSGVDIAINSKSESKELTGDVIQLMDAIDLSTKLSNNDKALSCLSKKWNEFQLRRSVSTPDGCVLNESLNIIYGKNSEQGSIQEMIKSTVSAESFKKWNYLSK